MSATELVTKTQANQLSYYRSQLYTSYLGINPLVIAAQPILSVTERVKLSAKAGLLDFAENLKHELMAFEARAHSQGYDDETIVLSSYILCATLDDFVEQEEPHQLFHQLFPHSAAETTPDKQFYTILDKIIDKPNHYLDLLELLYLCLSIGFQGKYKNQEAEARQDIINELYDIISPLRKPVKKELFTSAPVTEPPASQSNILILFTITFICVIGAYFLSQSLLNNKTRDLFQPLSVGMEVANDKLN